MALAKARSSFAARHVLLPLQRFVHTETTSGILLLAAAVIAMTWANSPWASGYDAFWNTDLAIRAGSFSIHHNLREWINDALMVVFFFVVGLEVKREFLHGQLADWRRASLPVISAMGGMVVPAMIYWAQNAGRETVRGWGIPMATDIAFALGVLALLGPRVPVALRVFLLTLATVDDIGAIVVIAVFYSDSIHVPALIAAMTLIAVIIGMRRLGVQNVLYYLPVAVLFWFAVLASGVHATIAGVVLGLLTPTVPYCSRADFSDTAEELLGQFKRAVHTGDEDRAEVVLGTFTELTYATESPADRLLRLLHPWSSFLVLPLFALANAGIAFSWPVARQALVSPATQGVFLGLVLGKAMGIFCFAWLAIRVKLARLVPGITWIQLAAMGVLAGIGFTVSLFISDLAFTQEIHIQMAKIGVLAASVASGLAGYLILRTQGTACVSSTPNPYSPRQERGSAASGTVPLT
jgi:NhaA family Na+:H+ antiporter